MDYYIIHDNAPYLNEMANRNRQCLSVAGGRHSVNTLVPTITNAPVRETALKTQSPSGVLYRTAHADNISQKESERKS